jgi:cellobiose phosphorylase
MYRAVLEYMAGIQPDYKGFHIRPSLPSGWPEVEVERTLRGRRYRILIRRDADSYTVLVNDHPVKSEFVPYV